MTAQLRDLGCLWIGKSLSPIEQISALSFLKQGHRLFLYAYEDVKGVPPGVIVRDAREVLPGDEIVKHRKTGSPALHSDIFRYALIAQKQQIWVDLDLIAISPIRDSEGYVFGYETKEEVNGAVLFLPSHSKTLQDLLKLDKDTVGYPPHLSKFRRFRYFLKSKGRGLGIADWPWGSIGPRGLTHYLVKNNEIKYAQPINAFYSIPLKDVRRFVDSSDISLNKISSEVVAIHLWGSHLHRVIKNNCNGIIPPKSFLHEVVEDLSQWASFEIDLRIK